jgi:hypothetical protein
MFGLQGKMFHLLSNFSHKHLILHCQFLATKSCYTFLHHPATKMAAKVLKKEMLLSFAMQSPNGTKEAAFFVEFLQGD